MERWASNTLRTLGIILTSGLVIVICLFLIMLSMCFGGPHENPAANAVAFGLIIAAIVVAIGGIIFVGRLARNLYRSIAYLEPLPPDAVAALSGTEPAPPEPHADLALHLSPPGQRAVNRLVFALGAQIVISAICWIVGQLNFWRTSPSLAHHNWTLLLLAPFVLYHIPYAILIYVLLKRTDRRALAYSLAVPAVLILQALFSLSVVGYYFVHQPIGFVLLALPWTVHIVILILAYQAIQQVGLHPEPPSLIVAALVALVFFSIIHAAIPLIYRFTLR